MKFDKLANKILEGFNIAPQAQYVPSVGPDQGMVTGDINNTFPSSIKRINIPLRRNKSKKNKTKRHPKEN